MKKLASVSALFLSSLLAACGGGGGSPGDTKLPYNITLQTNKSQLPINIGNQPPGIGAYARYTTTLYVQAREGSAPILGGEDIFACNVAGGLDSGALYYIDGKTEHEDENKNPLAFRSITLGANSGGNSFHFHAGTKAGTARITCSVTNPADQQVSSASVDIVVGAETGKAASVIATAQAPGYLGSRDNLNMLKNNVVVQAFLMDDANQPIPAPSADNLQVRILETNASVGARLLSGAKSGSVLQVRTIGGVGEVSLASGSNSGVIVLEFVTDRFDNNVSNGIQDPIVSLYAVGVYDSVASSVLAITTTAVASAQVGNQFAFALEASGGVPPYSWSAVGGLPSGLTVGSSGIIQGTPSVEGTFNVVISVRDAVGAVSTSNLVITVAPAPVVPTPPTPTPTPPAPVPLSITGCSADTVCQLPPATGGSPYAYAFSASGGDTTKPVTWVLTPTSPAPWLTTTAAGSNSVISGMAPVATMAAQCTVSFIATATRDTVSVSGQVSIKVTGGVCPA